MSDALSFFEQKKKKEEEASPQGKNRATICGERKLNLLNIKVMLRGSLTSDKKIK